MKQIKYAHPANVYFVSKSFVGDLAERYQYYSTLASALADAGTGTTIISYDPPEAHTQVAGVKVQYISSSADRHFIARFTFGFGLMTLMTVIKNEFGVVGATPVKQDVGWWRFAFTASQLRGGFFIPTQSGMNNESSVAGSQFIANGISGYIEETTVGNTPSFVLDLFFVDTAGDPIDPLDTATYVIAVKAIQL